MLEYRKVAGTTDVSVVIRIIDSTDGTPETAVEHNTSGIDLQYRREGATSTAITEAALTALTDAHSDGGIEHIGNGYYRLDLPDAACASGAAGVLVHGTVTGMVVIGCYVHLESVPADIRHISGAAVSTSTAQLGVNVVNFGGSAGTFASGIPQASLTTSAINAVADQVFDEAMSGHRTAGSFGALHQPLNDGTAQAGAAGTITLASGASSTDDFYNNAIVQIIAGTGIGQARFISDYVGSTRVATVNSNWVTNPDNTSVYVVIPFASIPGASAPSASDNADAVWQYLTANMSTAGSIGVALKPLRQATAQAGGASTITLDASASATNDLYNYNIITIIAGTGAGQSRQVTDYVGSSKVATVGIAWATQPSSDSVFIITPLGVDAATVAAIATGVWAATRAGNATAGSFGEYVNADAIRLSGDATAADNAESFFDGTGYNGANNVIPSVTTVTGNVNGNVGGTVGSVTGAVGSVTGNVGGNVAGSVGSVTGAVGSVTGNVGGNVTGSVGSLAAQAKADVNAEVLDVVSVDTFAQPGQENPAATTTIMNMIRYLYKGFRNKHTQTTTEYTLFADDGTTTDQKATVSDSAGTFTRGEIGTGA